MPHYYPVVFPAGRSLAGDSLGFHAYSFRVDNCTNQWYLEESTVSYIPPYSLGMCLRLYGTGVAILLAQAPVGQPQAAPIAGEQVVGVYSDQLRTEVAAAPIRNFSLIQTVSDFQQGPQPANPPNSTTRMWADTSGNLHRLLPNGTDAQLVDSSNVQTYINASALGNDLYGSITSASIGVRNAHSISAYNAAGALVPAIQYWSDNTTYINGLGQAAATQFMFRRGGDLANLAYIDNVGNVVAALNLRAATGGVATGPSFGAGWPIAGDANFSRGSSQGYVFVGDASHYYGFDGTNYHIVNAPVQIDQGALYLGPVGATCNLVNTGSAAGRFDSSLTVTSQVITPSLWVNGALLTAQSAGGQQALLAASGNGDFVLGGGLSRLYFHPNLSVYLAQNYPSLDVGGFPRLSAPQFWILSQACYIGAGRSNVEISANTHFYCAGSEYVVLDSSATSYTQRSSRKIKEGIVQLANDNAMARVRDTRAHPVTFRWAWHEWRKRESIATAPGSPAPRNQQVGFVAEDMQYVVPEAVSFDTTTGEASGINYGILTAVLWGAVRQLDQRLQAIGG